ncbi:MAG: glycosyltransferase family 2 protein [Culicoidibacterales bacterium]
MNPKASVIIAAYNIEEHIEKCLDSVMNQTLNNIEIIVVNDGSTDGTLKKIQKKAEKDKRIQIIDKKNAGLIEARKSGLVVANGEYLLFVDGDDWLELKTIEVLYEKAKSDDYDIVVYNAYWSYDDKRNELQTFNEEHSEDHLENLFLSKILPSLCFKFIKRNYVINNQIEFASDISYAEDLATVASLLMHNPNVGFESKSLYNYYQRVDSIMNKITPKILEIDIAIRFIKQKLVENGLYEKYEKAYEQLIVQHMLHYGVISKSTEDKEIVKALQKKYRKHKIVLKNNEYIQLQMKSYSKVARVRVYLYAHKYSYGTKFDKLCNLIKGAN